MRIEAIGINMQSFTVNENTSIADNNESFSEIIDGLSDEMSKTDTDVEHTKPMDYFLSEAEISLGLKKQICSLWFLRWKNYRISVPKTLETIVKT